MCGIAGFVGDGDKGVLTEMTTALAHRGPDGHGFHTDLDHRVYLGHRRLAVIDLIAGDQPMWNEDQTVGIVFNGEIYNHRELRQQLEAAGHRFASDHSDTEVLVHGYEQWGEDLPRRLNGMFAFCIFDSNRKRLFLARDRFGKKPLYFFRSGSLFAFSSELPSLLRHPSVPKEINPKAIRKYLAYGYIPAPGSPYDGVEKLPGGAWLSVELPSLEVQRGEYWRFEIEPADPVPEDRIAQVADELRALIVQAVDRRLESDVPLGVLLSGGIDSSAIALAATQIHKGSGIDTFSIGFTEQSYDESQYARQMATFLGTRHHEAICGIEEARNLIEPVLTRLGEPLCDPSILPTFMVCEFARRHVTVALSGDGGDELFAGYDPFKALGVAAWYNRLVPRALHPAILALAGMLPKSDRNMSLDFKIRRGLRGAIHKPSMWNPIWMSPMAAADISDVMGQPVDEEELYEEAIAAWDGAKALHPVDRTLEFFTRFYLQEGILVKSDRASMMNSLELRAPFLDLDLVEFARRLPHELKFRGGCGKWILRQALTGHLPQDILDRPKKGFGIPLSNWLREIPPPSLGAAPFLDEQKMAMRWQRHAARQSDERLALWCWMTLRTV